MNGYISRALVLLKRTEPQSDAEMIAKAQAYATLAQAEEQRTANLIEYYRLTEREQAVGTLRELRMEITQRVDPKLSIDLVERAAGI